MGLFGEDREKSYICTMEKLKEKAPRPINGYSVREEIMQGMVDSFRMEGIKIPQPMAYAILERVGLNLKCGSVDSFHAGVIQCNPMDIIG